MQETEEEEAGPARVRVMEAEKELGQQMKLGALDLIEVFSPKRLTKELARFGFRRG